MQTNLVIVESPAKAKTIGRFLGKDYKVLPSYGHIRDLKTKLFSINTKTFEPQYEIPEDKKKIVNNLKAEAEKSSNIWLASMKTAREKLSHGISPRSCIWTSRIPRELSFMRSQKLPSKRQLNILAT